MTAHDTASQFMTNHANSDSRLTVQVSHAPDESGPGHFCVRKSCASFRENGNTLENAFAFPASIQPQLGGENEK